MTGRPFALLGVNLGRTAATEVARVMQEEQLNWRSFVDRGAISEQWSRPGTPTFYLLDGKGVIRRKWVGSPGEKALDDAIEALTREAEAATGRQPAK
jgi:hypothetical protein